MGRLRRTMKRGKKVMREEIEENIKKTKKNETLLTNRKDIEVKESRKGRGKIINKIYGKKKKRGTKNMVEDKEKRE